MKYTLNDIKFGGSLHDKLWNIQNNPNATVANCISNCTTLTYGLADIKPVSQIVGASNWHNYLTNGWIAIPFDRTLVKEGDIIEWSDHYHVALVDKKDDSGIWLHCSWYTGVHGVAVYDGHWDNRPFGTPKEVSDFMSEHYPTRMYHYWELDDECRGVGGEPDYILVKPLVIEPDLKDSTIDQILVKTNEQNVRINPSTSSGIVGVAQEGYYNVYDTQNDGKYVWYEIKDCHWIAGVNGRVDFIEGEDDTDLLKKEIKLLKAENKKLLDRMGKIHDLSEV